MAASAIASAETGSHGASADFGHALAQRERRFAAALLAPAFLALLATTTFPLIFLVWTSTLRMNLAMPFMNGFVGFENYRVLLTDERFWSSLLICLVYTGATVALQVAIGLALALLVILTVIVTGFVKHGIGFLRLFVPKAHFALLLLLVPIEVISFFTRPLSLSVRLFANMLAGHTMLAVFGGFVVALGAAGGILSVLSVAPMLLIIAILLLELLVAFLQAYVFAVLTCIYLNEALHLHDHH